MIKTFTFSLLDKDHRRPKTKKALKKNLLECWWQFPINAVTFNDRKKISTACM